MTALIYALPALGGLTIYAAQKLFGKMPQHVEKVVDSTLKIANVASVVFMYTQLAENILNTQLRLFDEGQRYCNRSEMMACGLITVQSVFYVWMQVQAATYVVPPIARAAGMGVGLLIKHVDRAAPPALM